MRRIPTYILVVLFCLVVVFMGLSSPAHAASSKIEELKEACKANPTHVICQEREAKRQAAREKRAAKMDAAISRVKGNL